jgi:erythromycin esterase
VYGSNWLHADVPPWQATVAADDASRDTVQAAFRAKQKAAVIERAEQYYRTMISSDAESWNWRASHMKETVARLLRLYDGSYQFDEQARGAPTRGIVWAHNTHIGDARATIMVRSGRHNIGQLSRQAYGDSEVFLVGFATHEGSVLRRSGGGRRWKP